MNYVIILQNLWEYVNRVVWLQSYKLVALVLTCIVTFHALGTHF